MKSYSRRPFALKISLFPFPYPTSLRQDTEIKIRCQENNLVLLWERIEKEPLAKVVVSSTFKALAHLFINTLTYLPQSRRGRKGLEFSFIRP